MYKIIYNKQIIDVFDDKICFVKFLPKINRTIAIDKRQANGVVSSNGQEIYHIEGTKYNFLDNKKTVSVIPIDEEEYLKLTTQIQKNQNLEDRVRELEILVQSLQNLILKS